MARSEQLEKWNQAWSKAHRTRKYAPIVAELRRAANRDGDAAAYLAMLHRDGVATKGKTVVRRSPKLALHYAQKSAALGSEWGQREVAYALDQLGDHAAAMAIYEQQARKGDVTSMLNLAVSYQQLGQFADALRWYRQAAALGDSEAKVEVARAEYFSAPTVAACARALEDLLALARGGDLSPYSEEQCLVFVARAYLDGWRVPRDAALARTHLERAAKLGSAEARGLLADLPER